MKDIKFRIWDKTERKFLTLERYQSLGAIEVETDGTLTLSSRFRFINSMMIQPDAFEVQQFTGLHDKNGKEIYEGDVLRFSEVDTAIVKWNEKYSYFMVEPIQDYYFDSDVLGQALEYNDNVEVIGNIYDNPYLVERR